MQQKIYRPRRGKSTVTTRKKAAGLTGQCILANLRYCATYNPKPMVFPLKTKPVWISHAALILFLAVSPAFAADKEPVIQVPDLLRQLNEAFANVAEQVSPSVVVIRVARSESSFDFSDEQNPFWDMLPREFRKKLEEEQEKERRERSRRGEPLFQGQGSGVVIRKDGFIMTNRHVVDGAEKIRVRFVSGREYDAEIRGVDRHSDIAVIKVDAPENETVAARLGDSDKVRVGEFAVAIGAPFDLDYSVTFGHISAKGRSRIINDPIMDQDFLQTDANINPGNSGGPLVNVYGEVVGINTLIRGMRTGIGFAIPINLAREVAYQLIETGKFTRPWLGIRIQALRDFPRAGSVVDEGVVVDRILREGPAYNSELKTSDVIVAVDGQSVRTAQELKNELRSKRAGEEVLLEIYRNNAPLKIKVKTDVWPEQLVQASEPARRTESSRDEEKDAAANLGLSVEELNEELAEQFGVKKVKGVIVVDVEQGSIAHEQGLRAGDIITEVDRKATGTPDELREALTAGDLEKGIKIDLIRKGDKRSETLKDSGD